MTWWGWIIFWVIFWVAALAYLGWRTWRLWPHARAFAHTASDAMSRAQQVRERAEQTRHTSSGEHAALVSRCDTDALAWNEPVEHWREQVRQGRKRRRELHLDDHTQVWATWRRPLD